MAKTKFRKIIAVLLTLTLIFGTLQVSAFATPEQPVISSEQLNEEPQLGEEPQLNEEPQLGQDTKQSKMRLEKKANGHIHMQNVPNGRYRDIYVDFTEESGMPDTYLDEPNSNDRNNGRGEWTVNDSDYTTNLDEDAYTLVERIVLTKKNGDVEYRIAASASCNDASGVDLTFGDEIDLTPLIPAVVNVYLDGELQSTDSETYQDSTLGDEISLSEEDIASYNTFEDAVYDADADNITAGTISAEGTLVLALYFTTEEEQEQLSENTIPVKFYVLNPGINWPANGANMGVENYYPYADGSNSAYFTTANGIPGGSLTQLGIEELTTEKNLGNRFRPNYVSGIFVGNQIDSISAGTSDLREYVNMPSDWGALEDIFNLDGRVYEIIPYVVKVQYGNGIVGEDAAGSDADIHVDCYIANVPIHVYYHPNYSDYTGEVDVYDDEVISGEGYEVKTYMATGLTDRDGYTFLGWAENANGSVVYEPGDIIEPLMTTKHLYAKWSKNVVPTYDYMVVANYYTNDVIDNEEAVLIDSADDVTALPTTDEVAAEYSADNVVYGENTYEYTSINFDEETNTFILRYDRTYVAPTYDYTVVANYYTNFELDNEDVVSIDSVEDVTALPTTDEVAAEYSADNVVYSENTYEYTSINFDEETYTFILRYDRSVTAPPPGPGPNPMVRYMVIADYYTDDRLDNEASVVLFESGEVEVIPSKDDIVEIYAQANDTYNGNEYAYVEIEYDEESNTFLLMYERFSLTVNWITDDNKTLRDTEVTYHPANSKYATLQHTFTGYKFDSTSGDAVNGVMDTAKEVTYIYVERAPYVPPYVPPVDPIDPPVPPTNPVEPPVVPVDPIEIIDEPTPLEELPDEEIPLSDVPKTSDMSSIWYLLILISGGGLTTLLILNRRREKNAV